MNLALGSRKLAAVGVAVKRRPVEPSLRGSLGLTVTDLSLALFLGLVRLAETFFYDFSSFFGLTAGTALRCLLDLATGGYSQEAPDFAQRPQTGRARSQA